MSCTSPICSVSPSRSSTGSVSFWPFTSVPRVLFRSLISKTVPFRKTAACLRETDLGCKTTSQSGLRPMIVTSRSNLYSRPAMGPCMTWSVGTMLCGVGIVV